MNQVIDSNEARVERVALDRSADKPVNCRNCLCIESVSLAYPQREDSSWIVSGREKPLASRFWFWLFDYGIHRMDRRGWPGDAEAIEWELSLDQNQTIKQAINWLASWQSIFVDSAGFWMCVCVLNDSVTEWFSHTITEEEATEQQRLARLLQCLESSKSERKARDSKALRNRLELKLFQSMLGTIVLTICLNCGWSKPFRLQSPFS